MKRYGLAAVLSVFCVLFGCGEYYMLKQSAKPEIKPAADKATVVVYRMSSVSFAVVVDNYIDKKLIGQTKGKSYFIAQVDPGTHYIIALSDNKTSAKINLEAGKVYYILQGMAFGGTFFSGTNPDEFNKQLPELDYLSFDPAKPAAPALSDEIYNEKVKDYNEESAKDPERFKDMNNLTGY